MGPGQGRDLRSVLADGGPLGAERAVMIVRQIAAALDDAHANQVIHRDITPATILVADNDYAYLADVGAVTASVDTAALAYRAPELLANTAITYRADVYALACVLYECLTGTPAFPTAGEPAELIDAHLSGPIPYPSEQEHLLPPGFDAVIARGLAKNPDHRYQHAAELAEAARAALDGGHQPAYNALPTMAWQTPEAAPPPAAPRKRRRRVPIAIAAVAALVAAGLGTTVALSKSADSTDKPSGAAQHSQHSYSSQPVELPFGDLVSPRRVAVDGAGNVYVLDGELGSRRVLKLAAGSTAPITVDVPDVDVPWVTDLAVDEPGSLYLSGTSREEVWELAAGTPRPIRLPFGNLVNVKGLAVDRDGNIYLTADVRDAPGDLHNWDSHTGVLKLVPGAAQPTILPFPDDLNLPKAVGVDAAGTVYVIDSVKGSATTRILKLAAGTKAAVELPTNDVTNPESMAVDGAGTVFIAQTNTAGVLELTPGATNWTRLPIGSNDTFAVAVDNDDNVYVTVVPQRRSGKDPPRVLKLAANR